ncbi:MAG: enoyl-CoA hydratase, partial [Coprococcus sp.]|nr:enoyl-CoA hydratase [Coprococcus sp.]
RACKKAINEGLDLPMDEAIVLEEKLFGSCFKTHDQIEGMEAFLTKRKEKNFINA